MVAHPFDEATTAEPVPIERLARDSELVRDLYSRCDYAGALALLVQLIPALHGTGGHDYRAVLGLMIPVYGAAMGSLLNVGYPAHALLAAERCGEAADQLGDPAALAVAAANRARVSAYTGAYRPARSVCDRAANALERHLAAPAALDLLGFLHLARSLHCAGTHDLATAQDHITEAATIAARTGESGAWDMAWGPRNVALWQMALQLDTGRAGESIETARTIKVDELPAQRQVYFYMDLARGLADVDRGHDAVRMLLNADRVGPQHARSSTAARETAKSLLRKGEGGSALRGLCERMGVAA